MWLLILLLQVSTEDEKLNTHSVQQNSASNISWIFEMVSLLHTHNVIFIFSWTSRMWRPSRCLPAWIIFQVIASKVKHKLTTVSKTWNIKRLSHCTALILTYVTHQGGFLYLTSSQPSYHDHVSACETEDQYVAILIHHWPDMVQGKLLQKQQYPASLK